MKAMLNQCLPKVYHLYKGLAWFFFCLGKRIKKPRKPTKESN